jgi:hypothetical protein
MSKPNPETSNPSETSGGMTPVKKIELYNLEKIVEAANKTIGQFERLVDKIVEVRSSGNLMFDDEEYDIPSKAAEDFAVKVFELIVENIDEYIIKVLDCGEDGLGYVVATDSGNKVLLQVWDVGVTGHIITVPLEEADWCEERE